jgi:hypothetical protein
VSRAELGGGQPSLGVDDAAEVRATARRAAVEQRL